MPRPLSSTDRSTLRRFPDRGRCDRAELYDLLDEGFLCHLSSVVEGAPRVIPMVYGRVDDVLYLHGSVANRILSQGGDQEVCVAVTHVYGLVLANSLFHHSLNFRSAMVYAVPRVVRDDDEKRQGVAAAAEQMVPGRSVEVRPPSVKELAATTVLAVPLAEASVKVRIGPPYGSPEDYATHTWSGVLPLQQHWGAPEPDPAQAEDIPVPAHVARLVGTSVLRAPTV